MKGFIAAILLLLSFAQVETKGSQGISSITACYMSTGANGKSSFQYDPAFSGCYNSWFVYCPNGATALSTSEAGKTVRQMCLNGAGIDQAKKDGNQKSYCPPT